MKKVATELGIGVVGAPKGQNPKLVANLKRVQVPGFQERLKLGLKKAEEYANNNNQQ